MRILYIHQYFKTPDEGGAIRSYYLARGLVAHGFSVDMLTAHEGTKYLKKEIEGITVHYLPVKYRNEFGFFRRILAFLYFVWLAKKWLKNNHNFDKVYASSTPLTVGWIATFAKEKFGIPYYFEVRDLWPEAPIQMGVIKSGWLKRWLRSQEYKIYLQAEKIIALSPGMRNAIMNLVPGKPVYVIPNMSDCSFFKFSSKNQALLQQYQLNDRFVVGYFGSIGRVNRLDFFLEFAQKAELANDKFTFFIIGKGADLPRLKKKVEAKKLRHLHFIPFQNKEGIKQWLSVFDAAYISFDKMPVLETNSPNKYFDALAAGKLIITNTNGWIKDIIENTACGFYANPDDLEAAIQRLESFYTDPNKLHNYQRNARQLAVQYYARSIQVKKLIGIFNDENHLKINDDSVYILTA